MVKQEQKYTSRIMCVVAAMIFVISHSPAPAYAQRAVQGGRAMDANTHVYNGKYNAPLKPFLLNDLNNAIVTGNVPQGLGFRGDVGYLAAGDFRGATSTDKFYRFQTDSYFSGLPLLGYKPFQSLGYDVNISGKYLANPFAATMLKRQFSATNLINTAQYNSAQTMSRKYNTGGSLNDIKDFTKAVDLLDQDYYTGQVTNMLYKSSLNQYTNFNTQRKLDRKVRIYNFQTLPDNITESSDRYSLDTITNKYNSSELTDNNYLNANPDIKTPPLFNNNSDRLISNQLKIPNEPATSINRTESPLKKSGTAQLQLKFGQDPYADLLANMVSARNPSLNPAAKNNYNPAAGKIYTNDILQAMQDLDKQLAKIGYDIASRQNNLNNTKYNPLKPKPIPESNTIINPQNKTTKIDFRDMSHLDIKALTAKIKPIKKLSSETSNTKFNKIIANAENALAAGRYFDAEKYFRTALRLTPDHPFAQAGKIHAQMGAGLYLSASSNLRSLFTHHPEFIGIKYDQNLIPPSSRINSLITDIMNLMEDPRWNTNSGLLLAYAGHLTAQPDLIKQGLDNWQKNAPDDTLAQIAREVWLP